MLSVILLFFNGRKFRSSIYLSLFFLFTSLYGFYQYALLYSKSVPLISGLLFCLSLVIAPLYLIGPMLYWYTRSVLTDRSKLSRRDFWHFLPMLVYMLSALPNCFVPWADKVEAARELVRNQEYLMLYKPTLVSQVIPQVFIYLFRLLLVLGYSIWSVMLLFRFSFSNNISAVLSKQRFIRTWLINLLGFSLLLVLCQIFMVIRGFEMHFSERFYAFQLLRAISVAGLAGLLVSAFFFPSILYGMPRIPSGVLPEDTDPAQTGPQPVAAARPVQHLESAYLQMIFDKAEAFMAEHQPYLQPGFNLAQLSVYIQVPAHHLGYFFREVRKQRFNDYRNEWRIRHAKKLIEDGKAGEMTLEAIGKLSGFSSRNAFITDFKKLQGESPGAYAARLHYSLP
jgi:AraC-like DNA-binding protein